MRDGAERGPRWPRVSGQFVHSWTARDDIRSGRNGLRRGLRDCLDEPRAGRRIGRFRAALQRRGGRSGKRVFWSTRPPRAINEHSPWRWTPRATSSSHGTERGSATIAAFSPRLYNAAGVAQGDEFRVNTTTSGYQGFSAVAMDAAGNFVVTWSGNGVGDSFGVFARRFDAAGVSQGGEFRVNIATSGFQRDPSVAMNGAGNFVIAWDGQGTGDDQGVYSRQYAANGIPLGNAFLVNDSISGVQRDSAVALDAAGNFVVAWHGNGPGDTNGIYVRRFEPRRRATGKRRSS